MRKKRKFLYLGPLVTSNTLERPSGKNFQFRCATTKIYSLCHLSYSSLYKEAPSCLSNSYETFCVFISLWCEELHWLQPPPLPHIPSRSFHLNRCLRKRKLIDYTPFFLSRKVKVCIYKTAIRQIRLEVTDALIFKYAFLLRDTFTKTSKYYRLHPICSSPPREA